MGRIKKHGEFFYFLSEAELEHLAEAKGWLAERVKACEESAGASRGRVCADTVLTVRNKYYEECITKVWVKPHT